MMKCNEFEKSKPRHHKNLDNLDTALQDLGFSPCKVTEAHRESRARRIAMMRLNTRFVSNVTVGYCMRRAPNKNRLCPYVLPERHRTKSENSDAMTSDVKDGEYEFKSILEEPSTSGYKYDCTMSPAKRCQSLENLDLSLDPPPNSEVSPDMDGVSIRIQKLQVDE